MQYDLRVVAAVEAHTPELLTVLPIFLEKDIRAYLAQRKQERLFEATFIEAVAFTPTLVTVGSVDYQAYAMLFRVTTTGFLDGKQEISRAVPIRIQRRPDELYVIIQTSVEEV